MKKQSEGAVTPWAAKATVSFTWPSPTMSDGQIKAFANFLERHPRRPEYWLKKGESWIQVSFDEPDMNVLEESILDVRVQLQDAFGRIMSSKEFEDMWSDESCKRAKG